MSIQIGNQSVSVTQTAERLNLYSADRSQLAVLKSGLNDVFISMDKFNFGRCNVAFHVTDTDTLTTLVTLSSQSNTFYTPAHIPNTLTVDSNAFFHSTTFIEEEITSNVLIVCNTSNLIRGATQPFFRITNTYSSVDAQRTFVDGRTILSGPVGIGITSPLVALHVIGSITSTQTVTGSNMFAYAFHSAVPNDASEMLFSGNEMQLKGNVHVYGSFTVTGPQTFDSNLTVNAIYARSLVNTPSLVIADPSSNIPALQIIQTTGSSPSTIISVGLSNVSSNVVYPGFTLDSFGRLGLGTSSPSNAFEVHAYSLNSNSGLIYAIGSNDIAESFVVDYHGNVGIGTTLPLYDMHIVRSAASVCNVPLMALDNISNDGSSLFVGMSNGNTVYKVSAHGDITGHSMIVSDATIYTSLSTSKIIGTPIIKSTCNVTIPVIFTLSSNEFAGLDIDGNPTYIQASYTSNATSNIAFFTYNYNTDLSQSRYLNAELLTTSNLVASNVFLEKVIMQEMQVSNLDVVGIKWYNLNFPQSLITYGLCNVWYASLQQCMSTQPTDIDYDPVSIAAKGKIKIMVPQNPQSTSYPAVGLGIWGTSMTSTLVYSSNSGAYYEAQNAVGPIIQYGIDLSGNGVIGMRNTTNGQYSTASTPNITFSSAGQVLINKSLLVSATGNVGIGPNTFNLLTSTPPSVALEVADKLMVRSSVNPNWVTLYANPQTHQVGIGTDRTTNTLHVSGTGYVSGLLTLGNGLTVNGPLNFTGSLLQNGQTYIGSQWTTNTLVPNNPSVYISSNVGIGIALPQAQLHVTCNAIIGNTLNTSNINFTGTLLQNGKPYIGSQWTTQASNTIIYMGTSNGPVTVGVGTAMPLSQLHVAGNGLMNQLIITDAEIISRPGTLTTAISASSITGTLSASVLPLVNGINTAATYGSSNRIPQFTVDQYGRISSITVVNAMSEYGGFASGVAASNITGVLATTNLPKSGITGGIYGSANHISQIGVDVYGRILSITSVPILIDATSIVSGRLTAAQLPTVGINASSITLGTLPSSVLPSISASNIAGGTLSATVLPNTGVSASSISTGTLSATVLPSSGVNASSITTGVLNSTVLPSSGINASSITSGTLSSNIFPASGLNATSISEGILSSNVLQESGVTPGTYGSGSAIPSITIDTYGRVTAVTATTLSSTVNASSISGLAASATTDTTHANNITSGILNVARLPTNIPTSNLTGTLTVTNGGTGQSNLTIGKVLVGNGSNALLAASGLTFDSVNTRLGIGVATPNNALEITGNLVLTGDITAFGTVSDQRLKHDVSPLDNILDRVMTLQPCEFSWSQDLPFARENAGKRDIGLIAQNVANVFPMVTKDIVMPDVATTYLGIKYEKLVPYLIAAIQELTQEVRQLRSCGI